jgi:hypothetical protein
MPPFSPFLLGGDHIPQQTPMIGGWINPPSSRPDPSFTFPGESSQMGGPSTYYLSSIYPSSAMTVPTNSFHMEDILLSSSVSSRGSLFYSMGNPLHIVPSSGGNIYPHLSNPCHVSFSTQVVSSVMMPLQPFMNQFGGRYYPAGQGHGVYQNPTYLIISQNQSFPKPRSHMSQPSTVSHDGSTSPITASHTSIISRTFSSHVGDRSTISASHVEDQ